jgi:hypothetical protein
MMWTGEALKKSNVRRARRSNRKCDFLMSFNFTLPSISGWTGSIRRMTGYGKGRELPLLTCLLLGDKRTQMLKASLSAFDPIRT